MNTVRGALVSVALVCVCASAQVSERARRRAMELANDSDLRMKAPSQRKAPPAPAARRVTGAISGQHDSRIPMPGTVITREYKGRTLQVAVLPDGFEHDGEVYQRGVQVWPSVQGADRSAAGCGCPPCLS